MSRCLNIPSSSHWQSQRPAEESQDFWHDELNHSKSRESRTVVILSDFSLHLRPHPRIKHLNYTLVLLKHLNGIISSIISNDPIKSCFRAYFQSWSISFLIFERLCLSHWRVVLVSMGEIFISLEVPRFLWYHEQEAWYSNTWSSLPRNFKVLALSWTVVWLPPRSLCFTLGR